MTRENLQETSTLDGKHTWFPIIVLSSKMVTVRNLGECLNVELAIEIHHFSYWKRARHEYVLLIDFIPPSIGSLQLIYPELCRSQMQLLRLSVHYFLTSLLPIHDRWDYKSIYNWVLTCIDNIVFFQVGFLKPCSFLAVVWVWFKMIGSKNRWFNTNTVRSLTTILSVES